MDAYRIGISIVLANGVSPVLAIIAKDMAGLGLKVTDIEHGMNRWKAPLLGFAAIIGGSMVLGGLEKLIGKTKDFQDELIKLQRLGGGIGAAAASGELTARAFDISRRVPMKVEDLMKIPGMTYSIMGEKEAMETWEPLARYGWVLQSDKHYKGDTMQDLQALIRAGELSGRITDPITKQIDTKKLEQFLDLAARVTAATHGMVNPQSLLGMAQQGGVALRGLDGQGFYSMAIMAQAMGGHRAGTAYLSLWQQLAAGTMMKRTAEGLQEMGLLRPNEWSTEGGHVSIGKEASKRFTGLIGHDPLDFAANIQKQLAERGITDPMEQMSAIMRLTGRQTTQRFTAEEVANFQQMTAERGRLMQGLGADSSFNLLQDTSVTGNLQALSNAWSNLLTAVAGPQSERVVTVLQSITAVLNSMQGVVTSETAKAIGGIVGQLGSIALEVDKFVISLAGKISGISSLFTTLGGIPWERIQTGLASFSSGVIGLAGVAWEKLASMFDGIRNAISSFIDAIANIIGKAGWLFGFGNNKVPGIEDYSTRRDPMKHPMMFNPGPRNNFNIHASTELNVDGQTLAQAVVDKLEQLYTYPTGAPSPDGVGRHFAGDHNFADV
ncbi:hypothetical protein ABIF64_000452 [Bradyrhizobium japonicum]|uniref:hypothetical protein n=1 Tax=Bradyrhizobium japonicum TaxID=375 RepID=UPI003395D823